VNNGIHYFITGVRKMKKRYEIKMIHHNRCVVIPAEQLVQAGLEKGDYVTLRVAGDSISIRKARLIEDDTHDDAKMEYMLAQIAHMNGPQLGAVGRACAKQFEELDASRGESVLI